MIETGEYLFPHECGERLLHVEPRLHLERLKASRFEGLILSQPMQERIFPRCQATHIDIQRGPREQHAFPG